MSEALFQFRHPRECGDPLVFKVLKVKMDSRFHGNDGRGRIIGQGVLNE